MALPIVKTENGLVQGRLLLPVSTLTSVARHGASVWANRSLLSLLTGAVGRGRVDLRRSPVRQRLVRPLVVVEAETAPQGDGGGDGGQLSFYHLFCATDLNSRTPVTCRRVGAGGTAVCPGGITAAAQGTSARDRERLRGGPAPHSAMAIKRGWCPGSEMLFAHGWAMPGWRDRPCHHSH